MKFTRVGNGIMLSLNAHEKFTHGDLRVDVVVVSTSWVNLAGHRLMRNGTPGLLPADIFLYGMDRERLTALVRERTLPAAITVALIDVIDRIFDLEEAHDRNYKSVIETLNSQ